MMIFRKSVALSWATLFLFTSTLFIPSAASAACPVGSSFKTTPLVSENAQIRKRALVIKEKGPFKVKMSLDSAKAKLRYIPSANGVSSRFSQTLTNPIWELSVDKDSKLNRSNIVVNYSVGNSGGLNGSLVSQYYPASSVGVTVFPRQISRKVQGEKVIFQGFVSLEIDYSKAVVSGGYTGSIIASVDCR